MHSDLLERCRAARGEIAVPEFPWQTISAAAQTRKPSDARLRRFAAAAITAFSFAVMAAAAEIAMHAHIRFTPHGGIVISSDKTQSRTIHGAAEIREAAKHLDFTVVLPGGLPSTARPIQLYTAGSSVMAVTYDVGKHHRLWIFLVNPNAMGKQPATQKGPAGSKHGHVISERWRVGGEDVIAVADGLSISQLDAIRKAMNAKAAR